MLYLRVSCGAPLGRAVQPSSMPHLHLEVEGAVQNKGVRALQGEYFGGGKAIQELSQITI